MSEAVIKASIKNNTHVISEHRLGDVIHDFAAEFFHCIEYVALIYGICELIKYKYKERQQQILQRTQVEGQQDILQGTHASGRAPTNTTNMGKDMYTSNSSLTCFNFEHCSPSAFNSLEK